VSTYDQAGVQGQSDALSSIVRHLGPTLGLPENGEVLTSFGGYASVVKVSDDLAIAITTDGVGSKTIVAAALDRYDTIGFDCVAMNANDVICVGARPIAMVDYLGVHTLHPGRADEILRGLGAAAKEAGIAIPGGELAQLPEVIGSDGRGPGDERAFDLVGTCIGVVHPEHIVTGAGIEAGDILIGLRSSGIHSNGLTLARKVLLGQAGYGLDDEIPRIGRTLGDELLEPTEIYVRAATALWNAGIETKGLAHITSDGFANLGRLEAPVGYSIDVLPPVPAIFGLIQEAGRIATAEMYRVFNMGIGLVIVVDEADSEAAIACVQSRGYEAQRIGTVTGDSGTVRVGPARLVGGMADGASRFEPY
jgi:phosphoribosylformylglycinamidine cyclo-ligase